MNDLKKFVREYLGHNEGSVKVKIKESGEVNIIGSREDTDRSKDFWRFAGWLEEFSKVKKEHDKKSALSFIIEAIKNENEKK